MNVPSTKSLPRNKAEAVMAEDAVRAMAALASGKESETGDAPLKPDYGRQGIHRSTYRGRVHHSSHQISTAWIGSRPHRSTGAMPAAPASTGCIAIKRLAGKTAISSTTSPHAAARRVAGTSSPSPPKISKGPLTHTIAGCHGM
jgi:hypothetical protein